MSERGGFIVYMDERLREAFIRNRLDQGGSFSDAFSVPDWSFKSKEIGLVTFNGIDLEGAFLITRGKRVATYKARVEFNAWIPFERLPIAEIESKLDERLLPYFLKASSGSGKRITPKTWEKVWAIILVSRSHERAKLTALMEFRDASSEQFSQEAYGVLREERDAVGLSLSIFGMERKNVLGFVPPTEISGKIDPFLVGLKKVTLRENVIINHDSAVIPGWNQVRRHVSGSVTFTQGNQALTVTNVNMHSLESTLGVDLIYYHSRFRSFVLIQYKRLLKNGSGPWTYHPDHDPNFGNEIAKMRKFEKHHPDSVPSQSSEDYRLHPRGFYFKFAPAEIYDPLSTDLISGMYIPLDLWTEMESLNLLQGRRGGKALIYDDTQRYLNNSEFISLLKGGWIGTRLSETDALVDIVHAGLENNRSVVVSVQSNRS